MKKKYLSRIYNKEKAKIYTKRRRLRLSWYNMCRRCMVGTKHKTYYDRGIRVCDEWKNFEVFKVWALSNGYKDNLELDRINNDGNYEPSNCQWVTSKINTQKRTNTKLTAEMVVTIKAQLILGISRKCIKSMTGISVYNLLRIQQGLRWNNVYVAPDLSYSEIRDN